MQYQSGFGNHFSSEARNGALPPQQNSPQRAPLGLYAEQLSGSAFTAPRASNLATWLYRIRPSVMHDAFKSDDELSRRAFAPCPHFDPNQMRWNPLSSTSQLPAPALTRAEPIVDFLGGLRSICTSGDAAHAQGFGVSLYAFNAPMENRYFMNADAETVLVPQQASIEIKTELGVLHVEPQEIAVIPRGMRFQVNGLTAAEECRGYVGENFGAPLRLPDLGPIGANGLAHRRHFLSPVAAFEDQDRECELVAKFYGSAWRARLTHSPLDVVAWHGNYVPYKYDLRLFNTINTVSFDHPDPSIFTVLTSPSDTPGVANVDFVVFPPRWMVAEDTFRPPYFHRNGMSEYMGLIRGEYDAKATTASGGGFVPGGGSLHNVYSAHGPDAETYIKASEATLEPRKIKDTMAFMFESRAPYRVSAFAQSPPLRQLDYQNCWQNFPKNFR